MIFVVNFQTYGYIVVEKIRTYSQKGNDTYRYASVRIGTLNDFVPKIRPPLEKCCVVSPGPDSTRFLWVRESGYGYEKPNE
jgi:hypothetical protein